MNPDPYCRHLLARSASSAHYSLLFLAPPRRRAATALFALQRELDDAAQQWSDPLVAHARLQWWAQEIGRLYAGTAQHPVARALAPHVRAYDLPWQPLQSTVQARRALVQSDSFADFAAIEQHAYQVAGVFGEMAARICGSQDAAALSFGGQLAQAVHIVRRLRDAGRLARAGRSVFSVRDLQQVGLRADDLALARYDDRFHALMGLHARRARQMLAAAAARLPQSERAAQNPGIILGVLYETLLDELERSGFQVLHQRIGLTPIRKLLIAWRTRAFGPPRESALR